MRVSGGRGGRGQVFMRTERGIKVYNIVGVRDRDRVCMYVSERSLPVIRKE